MIRLALVATVMLGGLAVGRSGGQEMRGGQAVGRSGGQNAAAAPAVVVASKPFGESFILMEIFAQLLESRGYAVDRRPYLGATQIAFRALRSGAIDVYPEYTGTGLLAILHREPLYDPQRVFAEVSREFAERYDTRWLPPLGFENTYAIAVRRGTADSFALASLSDLAEREADFTAGFTFTTGC